MDVRILTVSSAYVLTGWRMSHNWLNSRLVLLILPWHGPHRKHRFPVSTCTLVRVRNLLPSNGRCLQSHYLATGVHATLLLLLLLTSRDNSVSIAVGYSLDSQQGQEIFLCSTVSRPALRPTKPPIQWVTGRFPQGQCGQGVKLTTHPSSSDVKNTGSISPLPNSVCGVIIN
jgi:hypothetical protein